VNKVINQTIRTRRRGEVQCDACGLPVRVGDRYYTDTWAIDAEQGSVQRLHKHAECVAELQGQGWLSAMHPGWNIPDDSISSGRHRLSDQYFEWLKIRLSDHYRAHHPNRETPR